ncbi:MAG: hypothetical protein K9N06_10460 [Candidatus Cloacimonetes bacterium]|nr:hypothetical protein [Candidatus Cloacimonadota bacterium]
MDRSKSAIDFYEANFTIHGEFNGNVYHTKRNGEVEKYPYEPVSHYKRTPLTIRNEWIRKYAAAVSNPHDRNYRSVIRKLNYYTPYILPEGRQKFQAETVFYVRERGEYEFLWQDSEMGSIYTVSRRTELSFSFHKAGEKLLNVFLGDELYCQRWFLVTSEDLDAQYEEWLTLYLTEILAQPEPEYESLRTWRRGMKSNRNWIIASEGKSFEEVFFTRKDLRYKDGYRQNPWIYHRKIYDHSTNPQTVAFDNAMPAVSAAWQKLNPEEKDYWNKKADKLVRKRLTGFNCFTSFRVIRDS